MMPKHAAHLGTLHENVCSCGVFNSLEDQVDQWLLDLLAVRWGPEQPHHIRLCAYYICVHACMCERVSACLTWLPFDPF